MKCPACGHEWKLPGPQAGGRAKVKKGFADPRVQAKAQATRMRKAPKADVETAERATRELREIMADWPK